jgi:hypothetical protein
MVLSAPLSFVPVISGTGPGDFIDLAGIPAGCGVPAGIERFHETSM